MAMGRARDALRRVRARRNQRHEAGVTLVELLLTVVIMSIAFVGILGALGTAVMVGDQHKREATAETIVTSWAESLKGATYVACAQSNPANSGVAGWTYLPAQLGVTYSSRYTVTMNVTFWDGSTASSVSTFGAAPSSCTGGTPSDTNLQKITLTITSSPHVVKTTSILKRKP